MPRQITGLNTNGVNPGANYQGSGNASHSAAPAAPMPSAPSFSNRPQSGVPQQLQALARPSLPPAPPPYSASRSEPRETSGASNRHGGGTGKEIGRLAQAAEEGRHSQRSMDKRGTKVLGRLGTDYENRRKPDTVIRENLEKVSDVLANHQNQFSPRVYNGFMNATRLIDVGLKAPDRTHWRHSGGEIDDFSV